MKVTNEVSYRKALSEVETLMMKGEANVSKAEKALIVEYGAAISAYEEEFYPLPKPKSLQGMIELRMFERRMKQKDLADLLSEPPSRISELLGGKKKLNLEIAKKLYLKLDIPADFILEHS